MLSGEALPHSSPSEDPHRRAILLVADTVGELMAFWNFKPSMGRVWSVLYLSRESLSAEQIVEGIGLSTGAVSMTIQELLQWGVVKKALATGERRRRFEAETDIAGLVTRVFRERELRLVDQSIARLEEALGLLDAGVGANPGRLIENRFLAGRVRSLLDLARAGRRILDGLVRAGAVDLSSIRGALSARIEARLER